MTTRAIAIPSNFRAYAAGTGVAGALLGAAVVAFLSVAAFVSFNGLPLGGSGSNTESVVLSGGGAPAAAAAAAAPVTAAVAAAPAGPAVGPAGAPGTATTPTGTAPGANQPQAPTTSGNNGGGVGPGGGTGTGTGPGSPVPAPQPQGALGGTIHNVDGAAGRLGLHTHLGGTTGPIVKPLDRRINDLLNGLGGAALNNPHLGDQASGTVNGVTGILGR
jgi:hypothetical protein